MHLPQLPAPWPVTAGDAACAHQSPRLRHQSQLNASIVVGVGDHVILVPTPVSPDNRDTSRPLGLRDLQSADLKHDHSLRTPKAGASLINPEAGPKP